MLSLVLRYLTPQAAFRELLADAYGDRTNLSPARVRRYHNLLCRAVNRRAILRLLRTASPAETNPASVAAPTLIQWGEQDTWLPLQLARRLAADIPDARLQTYEGVGHIPMEEDPDRTARDAAGFLIR